jgi:hypothetical protein|tara:strand:+ start:853 stop:1104 length:252 start_codon:yes stop_codon:yes gene_type:complete
MTREKYLRQRVLNQNLEIITITQRIDSLTSTNLDLEETIKEEREHHLDFIITLEDQVKKLSKQLSTLQMDMARSDLDKSLWNR